MWGVKGGSVLARGVWGGRLVKSKWMEKPNYPHASEQLMSIQQDCKLQARSAAFSRLSIVA